MAAAQKVLPRTQKPSDPHLQMSFQSHRFHSHSADFESVTLRTAGC